MERTASRPPPGGGANWAAFFAPLAVTGVVILGALTFIWSSDPEPAERPVVETFEQMAPPAPQVAPASTLRRPPEPFEVEARVAEPDQSANAALIAELEEEEMEPESAAEPPLTEESEEERKKRKAETKEAFFERLYEVGEKDPELQEQRFFIGPMMEAARRRREAKEGLPPGSLGSAPPEGVKDWRKLPDAQPPTVDGPVAAPSDEPPAGPGLPAAPPPEAEAGPESNQAPPAEAVPPPPMGGAGPH